MESFLFYIYMKKAKKVCENDEASLVLLLHCAGSLDQESLHSLS